MEKSSGDSPTENSPNRQFDPWINEFKSWVELTNFNYLLLFKPEETILLFSSRNRTFLTSVEWGTRAKSSSVTEKVKWHFCTAKLWVFQNITYIIFLHVGTLTSSCQNFLGFDSKLAILVHCQSWGMENLIKGEKISSSLYKNTNEFSFANIQMSFNDSL